MPKYINTFLLFFCTMVLFAQPSDRPIYQEPGKCYGKCEIPDEYHDQEETFKIYIQATNKKVELDSVYFSISDDGDWVYVGFENDLSSKQIEMKDELECIVFLVSETSEADYIEETIAYKRLIKEGGVEWREILCGHKVDNGLFIDLQEALMEKGYLAKGKPISKFSNDTKAALRKYQQDHKLPVGHLDMETLESLGIRL